MACASHKALNNARMFDEVNYALIRAISDASTSQCVVPCLSDLCDGPFRLFDGLSILFGQPMVTSLSTRTPSKYVFMMTVRNLSPGCIYLPFLQRSLTLHRPVLVTGTMVRS